MVDYSQYGQALILQQLLTDDTPQFLVDIGANDGICGSNSRTFLEQGWRGVLVEPMPQVFARLQANTIDLPGVRLVQAACSDRNGTASIRLGKDGALGQLSSLSEDPALANNLSDERIEVRTATLEDLLWKYQVPRDFGVLLVDTEGWDLAALRGLERAYSKPRIILTEDFVSTNEEKYAFLRGQKYQLAGNWGGDSLWVSKSHPVDQASLRFPTLRIENWEPAGKLAGPGRVAFDRNASSGNTIAGWAWTEVNRVPEQNVIIALRRIDSGEEYFFQGWRTPRSDAVSVFNSDRLLMSGFRAHVDCPTGAYELTVVQQADGLYSSDSAGYISLPL